MKIFNDIHEWIAFRKSLPVNKTLGVVMTMGALHEGHLSLIRRSKQENDYTVCTIFVNPTQFDRKDDFDKYPITLDADSSTLENLKTDFLLLPDYKQIYPDEYRYKVMENDLSTILCGATRNGHFDGVLTVVMKLLHIVNANRAYFGKKDFQQYRLIKKMAEAFFLDTEIIGCEIVRENDGLAMSSRNVRLSVAGREKASFYASTFKKDLPLNEIRQILEGFDIKVDYLEERFGRRFIAVFIESVRLIDNFELRKN